MYRLLIVDDEEIITDGLYEVFSRLMPEKLDVIRAYSGKEALEWMSRTRIDLALTDIAMPGMNGLELSERILAYWPRCKIVFLTGHSEFDYIYKAIQMPNARYLLKTEGYDKVTLTVEEAIRQLDRDNELGRLLERSEEHVHSLELKSHGEYLRHLLHDGEARCVNAERMSQDFSDLNIRLDPRAPVLLVLGHVNFPSETPYAERNELLLSVKIIWNTYLSEPTRSVGIEDKHGDLLWFLQLSSDATEAFDNRFVRYLEGTLELVQEACLATLGLTIGFTVGGATSEWSAATVQYERLRRLQQFKIGDGIAFLRDVRGQAESIHAEGFAVSHKTEIMSAHLEAGRENEFLKCLEELSAAAIAANGHIDRTIESYYSIALVLLSCINRLGLHGQVGAHGKLMRLDEHATIREGFLYLREIAEAIFACKRMDERDRTAHAIERICRYIDEHLGDDLSLVRIAEIHYFNPSYLSRLFKQERGENLSEYIDKRRIRKAKLLLQDGELKVRDVSTRVGYEAAHSFTRFFKKVTGLTPQEYRDTLAGF
jgi:two-component system response regulator YesN